MIYWPNGGMYFICTSSGYYFNLIYDVKLTSVIFSELHHLRADLTRFYMYIYKWYVFVKHKSVRMTILIPIPILKRGVILCLLAIFWGQHIK